MHNSCQTDRNVIAIARPPGWSGRRGWEREDIKFSLGHFNDIERLAMVGEKKWHQWMAVFCKPFTTAKIRYFDQGEADQAQEWLVSE